MLVFLMEMIYEVRHWDGLIHVPSFMKIGLGIQVTLRLLPQQFERLYYWEGFMMYATEIA
jgi:hypothetical protein